MNIPFMTISHRKCSSVELRNFLLFFKFYPLFDYVFLRSSSMTLLVIFIVVFNFFQLGLMREGDKNDKKNKEGDNYF